MKTLITILTISLINMVVIPIVGQNTYEITTTSKSVNDYFQENNKISKDVQVVFVLKTENGYEIVGSEAIGIPQSKSKSIVIFYPSEYAVYDNLQIKIGENTLPVKNTTTTFETTNQLKPSLVINDSKPFELK